jgi:predicted PurR-regulated permease PerM
MSERRLSISISSLFLVIASGAIILLLWQLRSLVVVLMIAVIIAATLSPLVNAAQKRLKIPRWLSVIIVYLSLISIITGAVFLIGPTVVQQIERLVRKLPAYLDILGTEAEALAVRFGITQPEAIDLINQLFDVQGLTSWTFRSSQQLLIRSFDVTRGLVGGVFNLILALLLSGYMLSGSQKLIDGIVSLFASPWDQRLAAQVPLVSQRMGGYIQGRILVSAILGTTVSFGLRIVGISEFSLGLGAIAGITNLIPFFGPILGSIPALIVALAQGGLTPLWVLLLFAIIQNLETYVLDPLLVGNSVKVSPIYQLLAVLGGAQVLGILGALIVPPWVAGGAVLLQNLYLHPKLLAANYESNFNTQSPNNRSLEPQAEVEPNVANE